MKIEKQLKQIPKSPGVYLYRSKEGDPLYVGKAANLKNRVRQYFQPGADLGPKTLLMVEQIADIEYFETDSEFNAFLLESDLIKRLKPKYNRQLKDDKSYPYIAIANEKYPRVLMTRNKNLEAEYFGPYPQGDIRRALKFIRKAIPYRTCSDSKFSRYQKIGRGCLFADIDLCPAPCVNEISEKKYKQFIDHLRKLLQGKADEIIIDLEEEMKDFSKQKEYEQAGEIRDQIKQLKYLQKGFRSYKKTDIDINVPEDKRKQPLRQLQEELGLQDLPQRIEGYDVSNIQGKQATASMVVLVDGEVKKDHYRHFKIRTEDAPNDVAMLKEALFRRTAYLKPEVDPRSTLERRDASFKEVADLVLIDGGKGQLNAAAGVLQQRKLEIPVASLAKREELVFFALPPEYALQGPLVLPKSSPAVQLLQRVRDEAHRFALKYHRKLRNHAERGFRSF